MMECYESCIVVSTFAELFCVSLYSDWFTSANFRYLNLVPHLSRLYLYIMESETPSDSSLSLAEVSHWWCPPLTLHPPYLCTGYGRCVLTLPIVLAAPCSGHFLSSFSLAHRGAFVLGWTQQAHSTAMTRSSDQPHSTVSSVSNSTSPQERHQETQQGEEAHTQHPTAPGPAHLCCGSES